MGVFDYLNCKIPLPVPAPRGEGFQTKSFESFANNYEIREDGTLWREEYDTVDRSDPNAKGPTRIIGMMSRENERWVPYKHTGTVTFYTSDHGFWIEYQAYFEDGKLLSLEYTGQIANTNFVWPMGNRGL